MRDERNGCANGRPAPIGPRTNGAHTNGAHHAGGGLDVPTVTLAAPATEGPIDLVVVQADDELVNALGARTPLDPDLPGGRPPCPEVRGGDTDDHLVAMLAAWRAEIDAAPIPDLVDLDAAVAAVVSGVEAANGARRRPAGRLRHLAPLAAAAAIIVATVTGVGLGSQHAMPGDTLWAVQKVVNPERVESVEAKAVVESKLQVVRVALQRGDTATAARELEAIRTTIPAVRGQEGQPLLVQEQEFLAAKLVDSPPGTPVDLSTPPTSKPEARSTSAAAPAPEPSGTVPTEPPGSSAEESTAPGSGSPDPRDRDRARVQRSPAAPGAGDPASSLPSGAEATTAPDATAPGGKPEPDPASQPAPPSAPGSGSAADGGVQPTTAPRPADQPPAVGGPAAPPGGANGPGANGPGANGPGVNGPVTTASGTTTVSGSAGASLDATATGATS
jgi:hypothetical protein